jgi:hypothetical protein
VRFPAAHPPRISSDEPGPSVATEVRHLRRVVYVLGAAVALELAGVAWILMIVRR